MPPRKAKKTQRKGKAAVAAPEETPEVPESISEVAAQVAEDTVEAAKETVEVVKEMVTEPVSQVANATSKFVKQVNGDPNSMDVDEPGPSKIVEKVQDVAQAASDFVDKMGNTTEHKASLTPEERKKKMDQLRQRMVSNPLARIWLVLSSVVASVNPLKPTVRLSSKKPPLRRSPLGIKLVSRNKDS